MPYSTIATSAQDNPNGEEEVELSVYVAGIGSLTHLNSAERALESAPRDTVLVLSLPRCRGDDKRAEYSA